MEGEVEESRLVNVSGGRELTVLECGWCQARFHPRDASSHQCPPEIEREKKERRRTRENRDALHAGVLTSAEFFELQGDDQPSVAQIAAWKRDSALLSEVQAQLRALEAENTSLREQVAQLPR